MLLLHSKIVDVVCCAWPSDEFCSRLHGLFVMLVSQSQQIFRCCELRVKMLSVVSALQPLDTVSYKCTAAFRRYELSVYYNL